MVKLIKKKIRSLMRIFSYRIKVFFSKNSIIFNKRVRVLIKDSNNNVLFHSKQCLLESINYDCDEVVLRIRIKEGFINIPTKDIQSISLWSTTDFGIYLKKDVKLAK